METHAPEMTSEIVQRADQIMVATGLLRNPYLEQLKNGELSRPAFCKSQQQFYFAVHFFSRPMAALLMRLPHPHQRLGILANVVEEHGNFQGASFHEATFRDFLAAMGAPLSPAETTPSPVVHAFNAAIMSACQFDQVQVGIACLGIIEYAFADISAIIGNALVDRRWIDPEDLVHYSLHAEIDKQHAADFFVLLNEDWKSPAKRGFVEQGLQLGAYVFNRLYRDLLDCR
ncbi:MAG: iron-containing redox enzyme family protein [Pirellulales bacterium]|nr:iron-containing redox enzyme family protein [Pirellulales bacterium]